MQPRLSKLDDSSSEEEVPNEEKYGNWDLIKSPRIMFACLCGALSYFCDTQLESIFGPRLVNGFGLTTMEVGYMFTIIPLTYIPSMMIVQCFPKWVSKRFTLILSALLLGCATFLNGPSQLFNMPEKLELIMCGQAFSGIFVAFLIIPVLPEMIASANLRFEGKQKQRVNTLASGLFNASLGLGQTIGPVLSAVLYEAYGFRSTQDIVGLTAVVFGILYFVFGGGLEAVRNTCAGRVEVDPHGGHESKISHIESKSIAITRTRSPRYSFAETRPDPDDKFPEDN